jgi:DNA-binding response OmpR family regulator
MEKQKIKLLYVEDDETLSFVTKDHLELCGYHVNHVLDGASALRLFQEEEFDLCLFDVMLPELDGFSLAKKVREFNIDIPILFLTAKSLKEDRLRGFELGGDDYITKPYSIEELVMKIEVFLRRSGVKNMKTNDVYAIGKYLFDKENLQLTTEDRSKQLTQKEADILHLFIQNKNQLLARSDILIHVWGKDDYFLGRSLDVFISKLRKYLKDDPEIKIQNIHGIGFKMTLSEV